MSSKRIYFSRAQIQEAIDSTSSVKKAAESLDASVGTFYRFMREYGIKAKNKHGYYRKEDAKVENTEQVENVIEMEEVKIPAETEEVTAEQQQVVSWQGPKPDEAIINDDEVIVNLVEPDPIPKRGVYEVVGQSVGRLTDEKQKAYGGIERVGAAMKVFYPEGIPLDKLSDALLVVRVLDKINRISGGDKLAFNENPWRDIAGYGILGYIEQEEV